MLLRCSYTPSVTIPNFSPTCVTCLQWPPALHVCVPPPWRLAEWSFSFARCCWAARDVHWLSIRYGNMSRPTNIAFPCGHDGILHTTHLTESLIVSVVTERCFKHPPLHSSPSPSVHFLRSLSATTCHTSTSLLLIRCLEDVVDRICPTWSPRRKILQL